MDLAYSERPVYILRTAVPGQYKTVGLSYYPYFGASFEEVAQKGLTQDEVAGALACSADVFNEKGLYLEADMRIGEPESTGIRPSTGTNPGAKYRMSFAMLPRFLGERCKTTEEAVALAQTADVHDLVTEDFKWGGGIFIADASGHFGVLDLVDNKLVWNEGQRAHANFYVSPEYSQRILNKCGLGRYNVLMGGIDAVHSEKDMADLVHKVRFSQLLDPDSCEFDPLYDFSEIDEEPYNEAGIYTTTDAEDEKNRDKVIELMRKIGARERAKLPEQIKAEGKQWLTAFQTIANCSKGTLHVRFFEDKDKMFLITVD